MATVNEALNNIRAQVGSGVSVGNGECYALASWYERMISPDATVGLGAGVGWVSGAIGDTISAKNIGTSYNWQANGWSVSTSGPFVAGQIVTLGATSGNPYGHVVIVEAVNGDQLTILEQNYGGFITGTIKKSLCAWVQKCNCDYGWPRTDFLQWKRIYKRKSLFCKTC